MESLQDVKLARDDATGVAVVRLDRPAKRNAFSQSMINQLISVLAHLDASDSVRAVVLAGKPDGPFCAGMDIKELSQLSTAEAHERQFLKDLTKAFAQFSKPIIAAVIGFALGGGFELALAADIIYAADDAVFGLPEVKIGTIPGAGGTQRLTKALGKHKAMELILTGDSVTASELARLGLVNRVFPRQEVESESIKLAQRIATKSAPVLKLGKKAILTAEEAHLEAGMSLESNMYYATFDLEDFREGQAAFLEKRDPRFNLS
ncbi:putative mitochondrial precursor of enoyl-CoA hydratase [Triangularia verruculosa]|uniref:Mitochondrial of enoyl-CoA hydratase n=1 Tax=Triangularia verruculosa TaxID=2587418 RepID=A0AAN6X5A8_9PEZI|nr:putative mitochondrial precursor of enoyl-CoA hydratase [Triangularia verruculosa]